MPKIKPNPKTIQNQKLDENIMAKISSGQLKMKPKWYFVFGSIFSLISLVGLSLSAIFSANLIFFLLRRHGPMGQWRLNLILESLPLWVPIFTILSITISIWLLKKYDFSYQKNFVLIIILFIISVIISAFLFDKFGFNQLWSQHGPMRRFYQNLETKESIFPRGQGGSKGGGQGFRHQNQ